MYLALSDFISRNVKQWALKKYVKSGGVLPREPGLAGLLLTSNTALIPFHQSAPWLKPSQRLLVPYLIRAPVFLFHLLSHLLSCCPCEHLSVPQTFRNWPASTYVSLCGTSLPSFSRGSLCLLVKAFPDHLTKLDPSSCHFIFFTFITIH